MLHDPLMCPAHVERGDSTVRGWTADFDSFYFLSFLFLLSNLWLANFGLIFFFCFFCFASPQIARVISDWRSTCAIVAVAVCSRFPTRTIASAEVFPSLCIDSTAWITVVWVAVMLKSPLLLALSITATFPPQLNQTIFPRRAVLRGRSVCGHTQLTRPPASQSIDRSVSLGAQLPCQQSLCWLIKGKDSGSLASGQHEQQRNLALNDCFRLYPGIRRTDVRSSGIFWSLSCQRKRIVVVD